MHGDNTDEIQLKVNVAYQLNFPKTSTIRYISNANCALRSIFMYPDCSHLDNCHLGQLPPSTIATRDKCYPDNCHLGHLPPRTTATQDKCHP